METIESYVILKSVLFETGHGFALGYNPDLPDRYASWQFTDTGGGRDYYKGSYCNSRRYAERDFSRRVSDYQYLFKVLPKSDVCTPAYYRYYSTQRPVDIGTYPRPPGNQPLVIVNYDVDRRRPVVGGAICAWGELVYTGPLTEKQIYDYELVPAPDNPDLWQTKTPINEVI